MNKPDYPVGLGQGPFLTNLKPLSEAYRDLPKKALSSNQRDHDLHVMLIMRDEDVSKTKALAQAYWEGSAGLTERLRK
ncbi:hypothetical protein BA190_07550 [Labrys sp. WJW]|uniref:hypothetical protein n=1 Tax=Labrys sp. WJW TaxID=1737983 RepID=UPI0008362648|nr:hypothetical protein [Labrys sp. WJW]OCC05611.1 hypothetical protein BA190_07550 [Labrys sp. WJW]